MRAWRAGLGAVLVVLLAGCGNEPANQNPLDGVVVIDDQNCLTGGCYEVTKVCLGPDLIYRDTRLSDENGERVIEDAPECER